MKIPDPTHHCRLATPLGEMLLAATGRGLAGAWFMHGQRDLPDHASWRNETPGDVLLRRAAQQLREYFDGQRREFDLPLDLEKSGTAFQQAVWHSLLDLRWGQTCSYAAVAAAIGRPGAVRAVGLAVGRNPISLIVPCHRVIGADGSLTGYGGGLDRKIALLGLEGRPARTGRLGKSAPR